MSTDKALKYGATGAAAGSVFGPWGTAIGGGIGVVGGLLSDDEPDPAAMARQYASQIKAPTIDPNAGIGTGWGGATADEQAAALAAYRAKNPGAVAYMDRTKAAADAARAAGNTAEADRLDAAYQKQLGITTEAANKLYGPDMSDPARFQAQAFESYKRQAPQVDLVSPDMANYGQDRSMFQQSGGVMSNQMGRMVTDPVANGQGQQQLVDRLNADLSGAAPSLAQAQLAQTTDQNLAAQRSMVASAGPMDYGAAQRAAIIGGANTQQQAVQQAAILRANEYASAREALGNTLYQQRTGTLTNFQNQNDLIMKKRQQELEAMGKDAESAYSIARLEAEQRRTNADLQGQQNTLNQNREIGYLDAYNQATGRVQNNTQFNATNDIEVQRIRAGLYGGAVQAQQQQNASNNQMIGGIINAGAGAGSAYSMMQSRQQPTSGNTSTMTTADDYTKDWGY